MEQEKNVIALRYYTLCKMANQLSDVMYKFATSDARNKEKPMHDMKAQLAAIECGIEAINSLWGPFAPFTEGANDCPDIH